MNVIASKTPTNNTRVPMDGYTVTDGLLRKHVGAHTTVVVSRAKTQHVIWKYHDHILANYPGWKETHRAVAQRFFWKELKNDVRVYVKS